MQNITSTEGLKDAIQFLESDYAIKEHLLKDQIYITYESLKPLNLIRNTFKEISSSPYMIDNITGMVIGLISGSFSKKIIVGASGNLIRKFIGSVLQFGVTNVIAQNPDVIKSYRQAIVQILFRKKKLKSNSRVW